MRTRVDVMRVMCVHNKALFLFNCNVWDIGNTHICTYPRQQSALKKRNAGVRVGHPEL